MIFYSDVTCSVSVRYLGDLVFCKVNCEHTNGVGNNTIPDITCSWDLHRQTGDKKQIQKQFVPHSSRNKLYHLVIR